jgi:hypothetical protein
MLLPLVGLSAAARPAAAGCRVRGERVTLENVVVRADRSTTLDVDLSDIPARATIGAGSGVRLDVSGAITFRGTRKNVWFTVAREIVVANGLVRLAEGAELVHARADGDGVVASVVQWADDVLPGEDKDPDEVIVGVRVPCRAVRLGNKHGENDDDDDDDEATAETTTDDAAEAGPASEPHGRFEPDLAPALGWWRNRGPRRSVAVRAAPRADAAVVTLATSVIGEGQFDFEGVEARGAWLRVRRAIWGAEIVGWIRRAELVAFDGPMGRTTMCVGNHGNGLSGRGWGGKPPVIRYQGPAGIRVGASIDFGDRQIWAKVRRSENFEVLMFEGYPYAELTFIPGVGVSSWYAMVDVADVILPTGTP